VASRLGDRPTRDANLAGRTLSSDQDQKDITIVTERGRAARGPADGREGDRRQREGARRGVYGEPDVAAESAGASPAAPPAPDAPAEQTPRDEKGEAIAIRMPVDVRSVALTIIAVILLVAALRIGQALFIPVVVGILASYALEPVVARVDRLRLPRALSAGVVLVAILALIGAMAYTMSGRFNALMDELPNVARKVRALMDTTTSEGNGAVAKIEEAAKEMESPEPAPLPRDSRGVLRVRVVDPPFNVREHLWTGSLGMAAFTGQIVLLVFLTFFLLASGDMYKRKLVKIVGPSLSKKKVTVQLLDEVNTQISHFLFHMAMVCTLVGVSTWLGLWLLGVRNAALIGVAAGVLNAIPYFGPTLASVLAALVALLQFGTLGMTLAAGGLTLAITALEGNLLTPWLISRAARMNPVAIFLGVLFWGWLWGVWGMLLAVPLMMVIKTICDYVEDLQPIGEMLGE
jgi:predicted PurR-regulated permease PerM